MVAGAGDCEFGFDQSASVSRTGGAKAATWLETRPGLPDGDWSGHPDIAKLLWVPLHVAAEHGVVLVNPDVDAAAVRLSPVCAPDDDEALLVLEAVGVEHLVEVVGARLPVGPDHGHSTRVLFGRGQGFREQFGYCRRLGSVLHGEHVARIVPRG